MTTLSLLDWVPAARNSDPETSHQAAEDITRSGKRQAQARAVLEAVRRWPGCTSAELAERSGLDRYLCARRLPELRAIGLVTSGEPRRCPVTGRPGMTWRALGGEP